MNHWVGESTKYNMGEVFAAVAPVAAQAPYSKAQTKLSKIAAFTYFDLTPLLTSEALRGLGAGDFPRLLWTWPPPPRPLLYENRRKIESNKIPSCCIPRLLVSLARQLEIFLRAPGTSKYCGTNTKSVRCGSGHKKCIFSTKRNTLKYSCVSKIARCGIKQMFSKITNVIAPSSLQKEWSKLCFALHPIK